MKSIVLALVFVGASALPMLQKAVTNGVMLEESSTRPTFAKGIRTDCNYDHYQDRNLGKIFAHGNDQTFSTSPTSDKEDALKAAKVACDEIGTDCGGVVETETAGVFSFQLYQGSALKKSSTGQVTHLKSLCAFPLPYSNFDAGEEHHDDADRNGGGTAPQKDVEGASNGAGCVPGAQVWPECNKAHKFNHKTNSDVEVLRWKLSNGPHYTRIDDGKDHGAKSRIVDGTSNTLSIEECMNLCAKRTDCMSGHYCESGEGAVSGKCIMSGDWDPYGSESEFDGCDVYRNFRQTFEWVKPVMRTDDGEHIEEQWHSKTPIDVAQAQNEEAWGN